MAPPPVTPLYRGLLRAAAGFKVGAHHLCVIFTLAWFAAGEQYLPQGLEDLQFYRPVERGLEIRIAEKLRELKARNRKSSPQ